MNNLDALDKDSADESSLIAIPSIPGRPLIFFIILLLFLWIGTAIFSSSIMSWFFGALLLFFCIKGMHPWDPMMTFFLGWGLVLLNVFSGLAQYTIIGSLTLPMTLIVLYLALFIAGYAIGSPKIIIDTGDISQKLDAIYENPKLIRLTNFWAYCSILSFLLLLADLIFIRHLNPMNTGELRESVLAMEGAGALAIIASFLSIGGFFCGISFFFVAERSFLCLLGLICFAAESFLSAGRQMLLMFAFLIVFCVLGKKMFKIPLKIPFYLKILLYAMGILIFAYLVFLTQTRDLSENSTISMSTRFAIDNNMTYSQDYQDLLDNIPQRYGDFLTNGFVYFANQVPCFCERFNLESFPFIQGRFLRFFSPFLERQFDKIFPSDTSYENRAKFNQANHHGGYISGTSWKTIFYAGLQSFGYLGLPIFIFIYGYISKWVFLYALQNMSFASINLTFINFLLPFYTQMYWGWGEQNFFFYSVIVIFMCFREKNNLQEPISCISIHS